MLIDEARRLAARIANTWRGGPNIETWTEALLEMDAGTAGTVFVRLRKELEHAPSIARFCREYRALATLANDPVGPPHPPCPSCHSDGWSREERAVPGTQRVQVFVIPCRDCGPTRGTDKTYESVAGARYIEPVLTQPELT